MAALFHALTLRLQDSGERAMVTAIAYLIAALFFVLAIAAFIYAAAVALTEAYGPVVAGVVIGVVAALLGLMTIAWLSLRKRSLRRKLLLSRLAQPSLADTAATALPVMLQKNPLGVLIVAAAAGFILQRSTQQRK
jgi:hypothetical protein